MNSHNTAFDEVEGPPVLGRQLISRRLSGTDASPDHVMHVSRVSHEPEPRLGTVHGAYGVDPI